MVIKKFREFLLLASVSAVANGFAGQNFSGNTLQQAKDKAKAGIQENKLCTVNGLKTVIKSMNCGPKQSFQGIKYICTDVTTKCSN